MMETKHTPGTITRPCCESIDNDEHTPGCKMAGHRVALRLASAAPDLAEATQAMLNAYAPLAEETVRRGGEHALCIAVQKARAALAKAGL